MSNHCTLRGKIPVPINTTAAEIKSAIMESRDRSHADFMESEIDEYLSADDCDENRVYLDGGVVDVCINLRGTAGFFSNEAMSLAQAFDTLTTGPAWLVMTDNETSPNAEGAQMLYPVGPTPSDKQVAKALYGMSLAHPFLQTAGVSAKHFDAMQSALVQSIQGNETPSSDATMLVSLDGGETYQAAAEGVRVIRRGMEFDDGVTGEIHLNLTHEGVITDLWANDANVGTDSVTFDDEIGRLYAPAEDGPSP